MPLTDAQPDALALIYARSLLDLAQAHGGRPTIEATLGELEDVLEIARQDPRFSEFLSSRVLGTADRAKSLQAIFENRVSSLTLRFLLVLNRKGRLGYLSPIVAAFDSEVQSRFGRVEIDVYTADPMSSDDLRAVRERLATALHKEVVVHPYTDGTMIGGVKFRIGDQLVDASIATRLAKLRDQLNTKGSAELRTRIDRMID